MSICDSPRARALTVSAMMLSALFLLPLCILSSGAGTGDASAHHDPGHVEGEAMEESGSSCGTVEYTYESVQNTAYASMASGYWAGVWLPGSGTWLYEFKVSGLAYVDGGTGTMALSAVEVKPVSNSESMYMQPIEVDRCTWSYPCSGETSNYEDISVALFDLALAAVPSQTVSLLWSSGSAIAAILGAGMSEAVEDDDMWVEWSWGDWITSTCQQFMFEVRVEPGEAVSLSVEYMTIGIRYNYLSAGVHTYSFTAPGSSATASFNPESMGDSELEEYGITKVTREQLTEDAAIASIVGPLLDNLLSTDEDVFFIATNSGASVEVDVPEAAAESEWVCFAGDSVASCRGRVDSSGRLADVARTCAGV